MIREAQMVLPASQRHLCVCFYPVTIGLRIKHVEIVCCHMVEMINKTQECHHSGHETG